jgi:hypothetical protein
MYVVIMVGSDVRLCPFLLAKLKHPEYTVNQKKVQILLKITSVPSMLVPEYGKIRYFYYYVK